MYDETDVNKAFDNFHNMFIDSCEHMVVKGSNRNVKGKTPWITTGIIRSINQKYKMYRKTVKYPYNNVIKQVYIQYKN